MKTYSMKASEIDKKHYVVDADGLVLGRMAAVIATVLRGKNKPTYTPHMDCGDHVIVINAEKVVLTGNKLTDKKILPSYWLPGRYPREDTREDSGEQTAGRNHRESCAEDAAARASWSPAVLQFACLCGIRASP
jgi:large subunit ribosomal protein L13